MSKENMRGQGEPVAFCWSYKMGGEQRFCQRDPRTEKWGVDMSGHITDVQPLYTHVDPGEVERLCELVRAYMNAEAEKGIELVKLRAQLEASHLREAKLQEMLCAQDAQMAEQGALLVKADYVIDHARTIDKQAFGRGTQNVDPGLFRGLGNLLAQYDDALSASAELSAPQKDENQ